MARARRSPKSEMERSGIERGPYFGDRGEVEYMKCAVSDFDGTLYVDERISRENLEAVARWQQAGNWFVIATGRNVTSIRRQLRALPEEQRLVPDALILNNGAMIVGGDGEEIYSCPLDHETAVGVLEYLDGEDDGGSGVSLKTGKWNVVRKIWMKTNQPPCDGVITLAKAKNLPEILQIHHRKDTEEDIIRLCGEINARFPKAIAYPNVKDGDVVARGVGKARGIEILAEKEGPFEEILVIGDSVNDLEMIQAYRGAAMESGSPAVKGAAAEIVSSVADYLNGHL